MRTVNVTDYIPIRDGNMEINHRLSYCPGIEIILEPMQKWTVPDELVNP